MRLFLFFLIPVLSHTISFAALYEEESGRIISNDPNSNEAQIAEATGAGYFCDVHIGTLSLIKHNNKPYLIGTAHGFYKESGAQICWETEGEFFPDEHYTNTPGIDPKKGYTFKFPPVNHSTVLKRKPIGIVPWDPLKVNDFVILELNDDSILAGPRNTQRPFLTLARIKKRQVPSYAKETNIFFISRRNNFLEASETSFEELCQIAPVKEELQMLKHNCDSGKNSSGASLITEHNEKLYSLGVHFAGIAATKENFETDYQKGNYFITSEYILKILEKEREVDPQNTPF